MPSDSINPKEEAGHIIEGSCAWSFVAECEWELATVQF